METRRLRGDLIEVFKLFKGFDSIDVHAFSLCQLVLLEDIAGSCSNIGLTLILENSHFGNRVVNEWNLLTEDILACDTLEQFKFKLDRHLRFWRGFL